MPNNPYKPLTQEDKDIAEKKRIEAGKLLKEAQELANKCLNSIDFVRYKNRYEKLERDTIDTLIDFNEPDPMKYAFNVRRALDELRQLRLLLRQVENDSRERKI